jgi:hypothetical protein
MLVVSVARKRSMFEGLRQGQSCFLDEESAGQVHDPEISCVCISVEVVSVAL